MTQSRMGKILRNLIAAVLLWGILWSLLGFPPYTLRGMCRRVQRAYFLGELTPVYTLRDGDWLNMNTYGIARDGEDYVSFEYEQYLLQNRASVSRQTRLGKGFLCQARLGTIYGAGTAFRQAETAEAVVETSGKTFTLPGKRLGEEVFAFDYLAENHRNAQLSEVPWQDLDLRNAVELWYWDRTVSGNTLRHEEIPCTLTLYDSRGEILETMETQVETYDIWMDW